MEVSELINFIYINQLKLMVLILCIVYLLAAKPWICEQCGKDFREEYALKYHALVHSEIREHQCDICSKR